MLKEYIILIVSLGFSFSISKVAAHKNTMIPVSSR